MVRRKRRIRKTIKPEDLLVLKLSRFMLDDYPKQPFRFDQVDQIGLENGKKHKQIHGKWSKRYPDLFIPKVKKKYGGLYLELKATKKLMNNQHNRDQADFHVILRSLGYKCDFCIGLADCIRKIKRYLK